MDLILDPIESGINSLLAPLTSGLNSAPSPTEVQSTSQATATATATASVTAAAITFSSRDVVTPITTQGPTPTSTLTRAAATASLNPTTTLQSASSTPASRSSSVSITSSRTATTLSTSIASSISRSSTLSSSSPASSTSVPRSTPAAPSATPALSPVQANDQPKDSSPSGISTAGIVVAIVFAVALIASIIYLTLRFCPPVRRRIDAWRHRARQARSYRETLDGPGVPEKDDAYSIDSASRSRAGSDPEKAVATTTAARPSAAKRMSSFFALGRNPQLNDDSTTVRGGRFSWEPHRTYAGPIHQMHKSPNSASPNGHGLGLGRVSMLRNVSLLRKAGYHVPELPRDRGPSMTAAQAEIARASTVGTIQPVHGVRRKPLPLPLSVPVVARPQEVVVPSLKDRSNPLPRLQVEIPPTPVERRSQIGLAVSSGTPDNRSMNNVGMAR